MNAFFLRHKKIHLWLAAELLLLGAYAAVRGNGAWMTALTQSVSIPFRHGLGELSARVPFCVMEALCALLAAFVPAYLLLGGLAVFRAEKGRRRSRLYSLLLGAACTGLSVWCAFCWLWGVQYAADGFQAKSGITAQAVSVEELEAVTRYFADRLAETADRVDRDENGAFAVSREDILTESPRTYGALSETFPFLALEDRPPKAVYFSRLMSRLDFTGVYCPLTGESCVNVDSPAAFLPSTAAHELAHRRGFASEQECNFLAVLACTTCGLDDYAYSGWLLGYVHLGNALYSADPDRWQAVYDALPETVRTDLRDNNDYWAQFLDSAVRRASSTVYDGFLKASGDENGVKSYGMVVDLLTVYYRDAALGA